MTASITAASILDNDRIEELDEVTLSDEEAKLNRAIVAISNLTEFLDSAFMDLEFDHDAGAWLYRGKPINMRVLGNVRAYGAMSENMADDLFSAMGLRG